MTEWEQIEKNLLSGLDAVFVMILKLGDEADSEAYGWGEFVKDAKARYEKGRVEHSDSDSTWDAWSDDEFAQNIREELTDCVIYAAARITRRYSS